MSAARELQGKMKFPFVMVPNMNLESHTTLDGSVLSLVTMVCIQASIGITFSWNRCVRIDYLIVKSNRDSSQWLTK